MTARNLQPLPVRRLPLSGVLRQLAEERDRERVSLQDLFQALGDRALAALLFVFAIPNVMPTPPGFSTILGVPLLILSAQLLVGRRAWLPEFVARRSMPHSDFQALVSRMLPWLERAERLLRPRLSALALPPMEYLVGFVCLALALVLVLPIPLGNIPPALAISLMALGILERDGLWVLVGLAIAVASLAIVSGVLVAIVKLAAALLSTPFQ